MAMLKWVVEFSIDESWIADGFDLTEERAKEMIANEIGWSYSFETSARIVKRPDVAILKRIQNRKEL